MPALLMNSQGSPSLVIRSLTLQCCIHLQEEYAMPQSALIKGAVEMLSMLSIELHAIGSQ